MVISEICKFEVKEERDGYIGNELIEAISKMEAADEWPIVLLLLELSQFRLRASRKSETDAVEGKKAVG